VFALLNQKSSEHMAHMKELRSTSEIFEEQPTTTKLEYQLPSHLVTVTDLGDVDFVGSTGTFLGTNSVSSPSSCSLCGFQHMFHFC